MSTADQIWKSWRGLAALLTSSLEISLVIMWNVERLLTLDTSESQECGETEECVVGTCPFAYEPWYLRCGGGVVSSAQFPLRPRWRFEGF